ncbi:NAD(P)/FAD-dependent oxidoreductase [Promicromonospora soli]
MAGNNAPRILVVGGGPTGTATAIALRRELPDAHVTLVDKATFPRDKTCGDGLGPGARRVLDGLGLSELLREFHMPMSVAISGPGGVEAIARGPLMEGRDLAGYVTPRLALDDLLLGAARDSRAEVREGVSFEGMSPADGGERVTLSDGVATFDLVIGADGAYSGVRRAMGVERPAMRHTHIAMRAYGKVTHPDKPVSDTLRFDFLESLLPVYGWVFPLADDGANLGVGIPVNHLKRQTERHGRTLRDLFDLYVEDLERRGFSVSGLERVAVHQLPHAAARTPMTAPGHAAVLLGDAAATINPLSGEGIFYGMAAGVQLAEHLGALERAGKAWRGGAARRPGRVRAGAPDPVRAALPRVLPGPAAHAVHALGRRRDPCGRRLRRRDGARGAHAVRRAVVGLARPAAAGGEQSAPAAAASGTSRPGRSLSLVKFCQN